MAPERKSLYEDSIELLNRINEDLKGHKLLTTLNSKMVGVVKDLNEVRIEEITGTMNSEELAVK